MSLNIYNTLAKKKEPFVPLKKDKVGIYVCGITLYDDIHIGHLKSIIAFDLLRNYLEFQNYEVNFVRNITDIDDKIINKAKQKNINPLELVNSYIENFHNLLDEMKIRQDYTEPRVTEYLEPIIGYIQDLIKDGYAYVSEGSVYFLIKDEEITYPLSGKKLKDLQDFSRVEKNSDKKNKSDFALWKKDEEFGVQSPWGIGRPGWHIECSVMHHHTLGNQFDIHGGGRDLIFPHHENEIVQSHAHNHQNPAKYWMHNGIMTITVKDEQGKKIEQKISKSLGNSIYVKDLLLQYSPETLKYFLLKAHYRNNQDYNQKELENSQNFILKFESLIFSTFEKNKNNIKDSTVQIDINKEKLIKTNIEFFSALDDDLNTPKALAYLNKKMNKNLNIYELNETLFLLKILGVYEKSESLENIYQKHFAEQEQYKEKFSKLLKDREALKQNGKWAEADIIRKDIESEDLKLMDLPNNQYFFYKLKNINNKSLESNSSLKLK